MLVRRMIPDDLPDLLALQEANLFAGLDPAQRTEGFLSARFSRAQFLTIAADVAVVVATDGPRIIGYLCASGLAFNRAFPLLAAMLEQLPRLDFLGRRLDAQRTFVYGPVCVDRGQRGRGVLRAMFVTLRGEIAGDYDAGVLFIAKPNQRSLDAHVQGLGMTVVGDFAFDQKAYWILAFLVLSQGGSGFLGTGIPSISPR